MNERGVRGGAYSINTTVTAASQGTHDCHSCKLDATRLS